MAGIASLLGALWWGRRRRTWPWPREMALLVLVRVPLLALGIADPTLWTLGVGAALSGLVAAPTFVVAYAASDRETDAAHHTEASTWVTSAYNLGVSLGTASTAWLFAHASLREALGVVAVTLLVAAASAALTRSVESGGVA